MNFSVSELADFRPRNSVMALDFCNFVEFLTRNPVTVAVLSWLEIPKPFCDPHTAPQLSYGPGTLQICESLAL